MKFVDPGGYDQHTTACFCSLAQRRNEPLAADSGDRKRLLQDQQARLSQRQRGEDFTTRHLRKPLAALLLCSRSGDGVASDSLQGEQRVEV